MNKSKKQIQMSLLDSSNKKMQQEQASKKPQYIPPKIPFPQSLFAKPRPIPQARYVYLDGKIYPQNVINESNVLSNSKYTLISLIPLVLYHQFRYFFNLFFLLIALSQLVDMLRVGFLFTYVAPLALVLGFTLFKQAYDDYHRKKRDDQTNRQTYTLIQKVGNKQIMSKDIKVGNIIQVTSNQRIPADLVLLDTNDQDGTVFIRTDQLDGETDWKLRKAIKLSHTYLKKNPDSNIFALNALIDAEAPKLDIYNFQGVFKVQPTPEHQGAREGLSLQNTLWGNCYLASGHAIGIVINTGRQMRSVMNTQDARMKMGRTDQQLNHLSKVLFMFMCVLAVVIVISGGLGQYWLLDIFRQVLLLSSIIPISLRVNLDMAKTIFSYKINHDKEIQGTIARNSQIPQQLGRVQYVLSDKTGTLTQNDMVFKKISVHNVEIFENTKTNLLTMMLKKNYQQETQNSKGPMRDIQAKILALDFQTSKKYKHFKRERYQMIRDFVTCLAVCHNVTPSFQNGVKTYQASSPDEIALVKIAQTLKLQLIERTVKEIHLQNPRGEKQIFKILQIFPFTSSSKRMGIIVCHAETNRIILFVKGADSVMVNKVPETLRGDIMDNCQDLSRGGLRTLVLASKIIQQKEYMEWKKQFEEANATMINRQAIVQRVIQSLQTDMQLLGITAVEDKLQQNIQQCLSQLRNAGINVWMITGDKVETAICIGISAGLKAPSQSLYIIKQQTQIYSLKNKLNEFSMKNNTVLVIDGISLANALQHYAQYFYTVSTAAPAVICCRVSPTQKAILTKGVKDYTKKIVLGIGDGGNDVGMIQMADLGVGIVGKEGKQAALASDFSILKFKYLSKLILWHGRLAYKNTSVMAQFVIHRGLIISVIQCIFSLVFYSVAIPIYNGYLMLGYTTIYTMLPVFCIVFDQDVSEQKAKQFPQLYTSLQKGRQLNNRTFLLWIWKSIYQGSVIMILGFWLFEDSFTQIVTITFTSLILIQILNVHTVLTRFNKIVFISQLITLIVYFFSIILLKDQIIVSAIDLTFIRRVLTIVIVAWLPIQMINYLRKKLDPTQNEKIMKSIK